MVLQNIFYVLGIVFMSLSITILVVIAVIIFTIKSKIDKLEQNIEEKIMRLSEEPAGVALDLGVAAVKKAKDLFGKKKK